MFIHADLYESDVMDHSMFEHTYLIFRAGCKQECVFIRHGLLTDTDSIDGLFVFLLFMESIRELN